MAEAEQGVLRRKILAARAEGVAGGPGADRGWRLALARAARDRLQVTLDFRILVLERRSLAELIELAPERALIAVLDGPAEGLGVIMLGPQILAGFVEAQTIGRIKSGEVAARKPTRTDAAMVAGLIDTAMRGLEHALAEEADLVWTGGFRYASFLDDPRPLGLLLEDVPYRLLRGEIDLAGGARLGEIVLALPAEGRGMAASVRPEGGATDHGQVFVQALSERVNGAQSGLDAVLARLKMPLNDIMALAEGAVLALPQAGLDRISLEGLDGRRVAEGRLGQNRGMRAIRLSEGEDGSAESPFGTGIGTGLGTGADAAQAGLGGGTLGFDPGADLGLSGEDLGGFGAMEDGELSFPATGTG